MSDDKFDILTDWTTKGDALTTSAAKFARQAQGGPTQTVFKRGRYARGRFDQLRRAAIAAQKAKDDGSDNP